MLPRNCVRSGRNSLNHPGSMATNLHNKTCPCCYKYEFLLHTSYNSFGYINAFLIVLILILI